MNAIQEAKLRMYHAVESYCQSNEDIISTNPAFVTAFGEFRAKIAAISAAAQQSDRVLTGITADKNAVKQKLCEMTAETAGVIYAFAATTGDNTLKNQTALSVSSLLKMRADALPARCQNVREAAEANAAALADYGITRAKLTALQAAIDDYAASTPKPRTAYSERKTVNAQIARLFAETDGFLKERADRLVQTFRAAHPDFVETYETARRIIQPPHTTTQLKGEIVDKQTGAPVQTAHLTATPADSSNPTVTAAPNSDGEYLLKPLAHGAYRITVTAAGYKNFQQDIDVLMGEVNDLDVEMEK